MRDMKSIIFACCGVFGAAQAFAQSTNTRSMTLQDVILQTIEHNFDIQSSRFAPRISQLSLTSDYAAYEPSWYASGSETYNETYNHATQSDSQSYQTGINGVLPTGLSYDLKTDATGNSMTGTRDSWTTSAGAFNLSQPLLKGVWWFSDANIQIALAKKTLQSDELSVRNQMMNRVATTEQAYYDLILAYEKIKVQQTALELAESLLAQNKRKVEVGSLSPLDEKQAQSQAATSRASLIAAYKDLDTQQNTLKNLITDQYRTWHDLSISPSDKLLVMPEKFDVQESWRKGLTLRPDYLQAKIAVEKQGITVKQKRNQLLPQLNATGSYSRNGNRDTLGESWDDIKLEKTPGYTYGANITVPLGNRAARANYKSAKAQSEEAELSLRQTEQTILIDIDNAIKQANSDFQSIQATRAAREYSEQALSAEQKKLDVGKSTSFEVLTLQNTLTSARLDEINAIASYNKDLSKLSQEEGTILDRFNLKVSVY